MPGSTRLGRWSMLLWVAPAVVLLTVFVYYPVVENLRLSLYRFSPFTTRDVRRARQLPSAWPPTPCSGVRCSTTSRTRSSRWSARSFGGIDPGCRARGDRPGPPAGDSCAPSTSSRRCCRSPVVGLLFTFVYNPQIGLVNGFLGLVGLDSWKHSWLGESATAIWSIIAMSQWQSIGYVAVLFIVAMQRIPRELVRVRLPRWRFEGRRRSAISPMPLVREMTLLAMIITVSGAFLVLNEVWVMTAGGPNNSSHTLARHGCTSRRSSTIRWATRRRSP